LKPRYIFIVAAVSVVLSMAVLFGIVATPGGRVGEAQAVPNVANAALARGHAPTIGNPDAKVHIVEFLDPACETCREFYPFVKKLMAANPDGIRLSIRHVTFHKGSDSIVKMLEAARKQGKYWEALEALLASQPTWAIQHVSRPELALPKLAAIGLNLDRLKADMEAPDVARNMTLDAEDAKALKVTKTPEYFVNGKAMPSFGYDQLQKLVSDAVSAAYR
jgi:protein-disulfide isomerase